MNVEDTFCIGKTMTCDLCFVPAGLVVIYSADNTLSGGWRLIVLVVIYSAYGD